MFQVKKEGSTLIRVHDYSVWPFRSGRFGLAVSVWPFRSEPFRSEPFRSRDISVTTFLYIRN